MVLSWFKKQILRVLISIFFVQKGEKIKKQEIARKKGSETRKRSFRHANAWTCTIRISINIFSVQLLGSSNQFRNYKFEYLQFFWQIGTSFTSLVFFCNCWLVRSENSGFIVSDLVVRAGEQEIGHVFFFSIRKYIWKLYVNLIYFCNSLDEKIVVHDSIRNFTNFSRFRIPRNSRFSF